MFATSLFLLAMVTLQDAQQALENGQYQQAVQLYSQYLQSTEEKSYEALYGLARSQAFAGEHEEAVKTYTELLERYPNDPDALLGRGRVLGWLKRFEEAQSDFNQVISEQPDYADAWQARADIDRWSHHPDTRQHLQAWSRQFPEASSPWLALARFELEERQFTAAREALAKARERGGDPDSIQRLMARLNLQPGKLPWEAQLYYEWQGFLGDQPNWNNLTSGLRYSFEQGTLTLQGIGANRFDRWDQAGVLDGFIELWPGAYGNVRVQAAWPAEILPRWDVLGELYQGFADTWEMSGAYRIMNYSSGSNVHFFQGSLGKYLGNWYLRLNPMLFLSPDGPGASVTLWARYYYNTVDDYVELRTGLGRRLAVIGAGVETDAGPEIQGQTNVFGLLSAQYFITPQIGLVGSLNYNYDQLFNDRFGASLGTRFRW